MMSGYPRQKVQKEMGQIALDKTADQWNALSSETRQTRVIFGSEA
jgi:hypothetical protein